MIVSGDTHAKAPRANLERIRRLLRVTIKPETGGQSDSVEVYASGMVVILLAADMAILPD